MRHTPVRAVLLGLLAAPVNPAGATILLFDQARDAATRSVVVPTSSGADLPADYGDNVTGAVMAVPGGFFTYGDGGEGFTPDVTVDIFSQLATATDPRTRLFQSGYGDLINVVWGDGPGINGAPALNVLFAATPGHVVDLYGFELAGFPNADYTIAGVEVLAGATTLFSATDVLIEGNLSGPRRTTFAFASPLSAQEILLRLDFSNLAPAIQDNIGIDSIRFGQTPPGVPITEPGSAILLLCALALTAPARRRCRPRRRPTPCKPPRERLASRRPRMGVTVLVPVHGLRAVTATRIDRKDARGGGRDPERRGGIQRSGG